MGFNLPRSQSVPGYLSVQFCEDRVMHSCCWFAPKLPFHKEQNEQAASQHTQPHDVIMSQATASIPHGEKTLRSGKTVPLQHRRDWKSGMEELQQGKGSELWKEG